MTTRQPRLVRFREVQRWTQPMLWGLLLVPILITWWGVVQQFIFRRPWGGDDSIGWILLPVWVLCGVLLPALFLLGRLKVEVYEDAILVRHFPFWSRIVRLDDIQDCQARTYRPLREYGGWGIRISHRGWAYNLKGNRGVQLKLRKGLPLLIGSQCADELAAAINAARQAASQSDNSWPASRRYAST